MSPDLERALQQIHGGKVLDVGTGAGNSLRTILNLLSDYEEAIGIDPSEKSIAQARAHQTLKNVTFEVMSGEHLEYHNETFETVISCDSLHHLEHPEAVLRELKRVLKPGGQILINEVISDGRPETENSYHHFHHWLAEIDRLQGISHFKTLTRAQLFEKVDLLELPSRQIFDQIAPPIPKTDKETISRIVSVCEQYLAKLSKMPNQSHSKLTRRGEKMIQIFNEMGCTMDVQIFVIAK